MKCRSCGAEMFFAMTLGKKRIPLDAEPVADGNIQFIEEGVVSVGGDMDPDKPRYKSHFATCLFAAKHRKEKK